MKFGKWFSESKGLETYDYFSIIINQYPIFVIRKYQDNHTEFIYDYSICIGILGISYLKRFKK